MITKAQVTGVVPHCLEGMNLGVGETLAWQVGVMMMMVFQGPVRGGHLGWYGQMGDYDDQSNGRYEGRYDEWQYNEGQYNEGPDGPSDIRYQSYDSRRKYENDWSEEPQAKKKRKKKKKLNLDEVEEEGDEEGEVKCDVCAITCENYKAYKMHALSNEHIKILEDQLMVKYFKQKAEQNGEKKDEAVVENTNLGTYSADEGLCVVCEIDFDTFKDYNVHAAGTYHKLKVRQATGEQLKTMCLLDESKKPWGKDVELQIQDDGEDRGDYYCKLCQVECNSIGNFEAHMKGAKHRKKLQKLSMTDESYQQATENLTGVKIGYRTLLEETEEALIGLEYIYQYKGLEEDNNFFEFSCLICDSPLSFVNLLTHLTGWKHRRKYIKYHRSSQYQSVLLETNVSKKAAQEAARELAIDIEEKIGRQKPRLRTFVSEGEAKAIMEHEHDRHIVQYRGYYWEEQYDGRPPPPTRGALEADFEHWKKVAGVQLPYETRDILEPDELKYLREIQSRPPGPRGPIGWLDDRPVPSLMDQGRPYWDDRRQFLGDRRPFLDDRGPFPGDRGQFLDDRGQFPGDIPTWKGDIPTWKGDKPTWKGDRGNMIDARRPLMGMGRGQRPPLDNPLPGPPLRGPSGGVRPLMGVSGFVNEGDGRFTNEGQRSVRDRDPFCRPGPEYYEDRPGPEYYEDRPGPEYYEKRPRFHNPAMRPPNGRVLSF